MDTDLHLPGYLQGAQYEYERHVMQRSEWIINTLLPMMPIMAAAMTMNQLVVEIVRSRLAEE